MDYVPDYPPQNPAMLAEYLNNEHQKIEQSLLSRKLVLKLATSNVAPANPRDGDTVLADGVNFNPGGGQGVYTYYNSTWNRLG